MTRSLNLSRVAAGLLCVAQLATSLPASAQSAVPAAADPERGAALKQRGDEAMDSLHYDDALRLYEQSYEASPNPAVLYNESRVYQARGQYPEALALMLRFDREALPDLKGRVAGFDALLEELRGHVAVLDVRCNQNGAHVLVNDRVVGTTPLLEPREVNAGPATVAVTLDGYSPFKQSLDLPGKVTTALVVTLESSSRMGVLAVRVSGPPADVSIDGKPMGMTPLELPLAAGPHPLQLHREGSLDLQTSTIIVAGQRKELELDLASKRPITQSWWFWTGVGVVVAGGAILTYALLTERSAGTGYGFSPGQASVALTKW